MWKGQNSKGKPIFAQSWKPRWAVIGTSPKRFYRSKWEYNFACYLQFLKEHGELIEWKHEPKVFRFDGIRRGVTNYKPDFEVQQNSGAIVYYEVKGWMDAKSRTKINRMKKYHPDVAFKVIDETWFKLNTKVLKNIVPGWETE